MIKIMKSYRFKKDTLKVIEESVKKINKNIGCDAYDNTKFLESLVYLYSDIFVKETQTRNKIWNHRGTTTPLWCSVFTFSIK